MTDRAERARAELDRASETAPDDVQEQLHSLDEGLAELVGGDATQETPPHDDRLRELLKKLDGLGDQVDGETRSRVEAARELIDDYRQTHQTT